jgi:hypothetical protein
MKKWILVFSPVIGYLLLSGIILSVIELIAGSQISSYNAKAVLTELICLPFIFAWYRKVSRELPGKQSLSRSFSKKNIGNKTVVSIVLVLAASYAANNLILVTGIEKISPGFGEVSSQFYSGSVLWLVLYSGTGVGRTCLSRHDLPQTETACAI